MAGSLGDLIVRVGANITEFRGAMGEVSSTLNKTITDASKSFRGLDRLGGVLSNIGTTLTAGLTLPLGGVAAAAIKTAGDFELSMNKIQALGDITGPALNRLREQALKLGADTQFSAQQAADGMTVFASAGFKADQIFAAMPGTLQLAAAGQLAIADAATLTKDVLGQFGLAAQQSGMVADILAQAAADSSASLQEMGVTLTYVGPVAHGAGQSLTETTAAIVALDAAGLRGEKAGTGLRGMLGSLIAPSKDAQKFIAALGVSISDSEGRIRPLSDIMEQFRTKLAGVGSEAEQQRIIFEIFGREAGNAAQVLIKTGGPALDELQKKLDNSGGAADRMAKTINSGFRYAMEQFKGSVETAGIALGTALLPVVNRALGALTEFINTAIMPAIKWFSELPAPIQNTALGFAAVAAAMGPIILISGQMMSAMSAIGVGLATLAKVNLAELIGKLGTATSAIGLFHAALIAAAAGLIVKEIIDTTSAFDRLSASLQGLLPEFQKVTGKMEDSRADLTVSTQQVNELKKAWEGLTAAFSKFDITMLLGPLGFLNETMDRLAQTIEFLRGKFPQMDKEVQKSAAGLTGLAQSSMKVSEASLQAQAASRGLRGTLSEQDKATRDLAKGTRSITAELARKTKAVKDATDELTDHEKIVKQLEKSLQKAEAELADVRKAYEMGSASAADVAEKQKRVKDILEALHPQWVRNAQLVDRAREESEAYAALVKAMPKDLSQLEAAQKLLNETFGDAKLPVDKLTEAYKTLGITTSGALKATADKARDAYETIRDSGIATAAEIEQAFRRMIEAEAAYKVALGDDVSDIQRSLSQSSQAHQTHGQQVRTIWMNLTGDIASALHQVGQDIGELIVGGEFSLSKLGDAFKDAFSRVAVNAINDLIDIGFKHLLDAISDVIKKIPGIGSALGGVLGGGGGGAGGAVGGAGGAAGGVGGAVGSAVSAGATGVLGTVFAGVSAVAGVLTAIGTFRLEGTMNAVEENTRFAMIFTAGLFEKALKFWPKIEDIWWYNWNAQAPLLTSIRDSIFEIEADMKRLVASATGEFEKVTAASAPFSMTPIPVAGDRPVRVQVFLDGREMWGAQIRSIEESGTRT